MTVPNTALNNILPSQATFGGKVLGTDGSSTSWVDPSGANKATNLVIGITKLSCAAVDAAIPIAVGDNDTRMPTADEKAALDGTGTPSVSNKYVTADAITGFESTSNKSTTTTLGTSDTYYPTQNAVKTYVDGNPIVPKVGVTTYDKSTASGTQNIAHGLGRIPKIVRISTLINAGSLNIGRLSISHGLYNGTTNSCIYIYATNAGNQVSNNSSSYGIWSELEGDIAKAVITVDATNIILTWTKVNSATGTLQILWEVQ